MDPKGKGMSISEQWVLGLMKLIWPLCSFPHSHIDYWNVYMGGGVIEDVFEDGIYETDAVWDK